MKVITILLLLGIALEGDAKPRWREQMALSDGLVAWYDMEQRFQENIYAWNQVPPHEAPLLTEIPSSSNIGLRPSGMTGKINNGASLFFSASGFVGFSHPSHSIFLFDNDKTVCFWIKFRSFNSGNEIFWKSLPTFSGEYCVRVDQATQKLVVNESITHSDALSINTWYFVAITFTRATHKWTIQVNDGIPTAGIDTVVDTADLFGIGGNPALDGVIDEFAIWDRVLSGTERTALYNSGTGLSYDDASGATEAVKDCRTVQCCEDDVFAYTSARGSGASYDSTCFPPAEVVFTPQSGEVVIMPTLVVMHSTIPGAVIRYTLDGTDPDSTSTEFTTPITVDSPVTEIRARAFVTGCPDGPVASAQYQTFTDTATFVYACDTPDFVGQWGVFAPDGFNDYHWRFNVTFLATTHIVQIDVRQLDASGQFTTGQAWSTKEYPFPDIPNFWVIPLMLRIGGVTQNNAYTNDYSASFGTFAAASHAIDLYGQANFGLPSSNMFELLVTFAYGSKFTRVARVIDSNCTVIPPPCPVPAVPTITGTCTGINVTFTVGVGTNYVIYRGESPTGVFTAIDSGVTATNPQTYSDATTVAGTVYWYYISNQPAGCPIFMSSPQASGQRLALPTAQISASLNTIFITQSTTISWNSQNVVGNVTLTAPIGVQPGNAAGSQVVSPVVTTTYHITGNNSCGAFDESVTVIVDPGATCDGVQPTIIEITGYLDSFFNLSSCALMASGATPWNGRFRRQFGNCNFHYGNNPNPTSIGGKALSTSTEVFFNGAGGGTWETFVIGRDITSGVNVTIWHGTKSYGSNPAGTYTRVSGCSSTPASLVIAIV